MSKAVQFYEIGYPARQILRQKPCTLTYRELDMAHSFLMGRAPAPLSPSTMTQLIPERLNSPVGAQINPTFLTVKAW